jgi:hypothetical protein
MLTEVIGVSIPIVAIVMGILCAIAAMYFRSKRQREEQETIRLAMEKGVDLPEDLFRRGNDVLANGGRGNALRRGIFWTMVGVSLFIALWVNNNIRDAIWGIIPLAIGIGFLIYYRIMPKPEGEKREKPAV